MAMNTTTYITTEYAGFGKREDGTWRKITSFKSKAESAEEELSEHIVHTNRYPDLYTKYIDYKVMHRTVITTRSEWEE